MVEGERTFHARVAGIFGEIEDEMVSERQRKESAPPVISENGSTKTKYFLAEVTATGWSEGEGGLRRHLLRNGGEFLPPTCLVKFTKCSVVYSSFLLHIPLGCICIIH